MALPGALSSLRDTARLASAASAASTLSPTALRGYLAACFAAGTPVRAEHGSRPVESLRPGDRVWARPDHEPDGPLELKTIEECFSSLAEIWHVHVGGQVVRTTDEHPVWVQGRGWTAARDLKPGDQLMSRDGTTVAVEEVFATGVAEEVFNFRVADYHTYYVGDDSWGFDVWAHNTCVAPVQRGGEGWNNSLGTSTVKVYGQAQEITGTTHVARINAAVQGLIPTLPSGSYVTLNRSLRTALGRTAVPTTFGDNRFRPDAIVVEQVAENHIRIRAIEALSGRQDVDLTRQRATTILQNWLREARRTRAIPRDFRVDIEQPQIIPL